MIYKRKISIIFLIPALIYVQGCAALTEPASLQQLRADYQSLQKQQDDLARMAGEGNLSPRDEADFKTWIKQQQNQIAESCAEISEQTGKLPLKPPCEEILKDSSLAAAIDTKTEKTEAEKTAQMRGHFSGSLSDFDEKLLTEQDRVKAKTPRSSSAQSGAGSGSSSGSGGGEKSAAGSGNSETNPSGDQQNEQERKAQQSGDTRHDANNKKSGSIGGYSKSKSSNTPKDIPDGKNDDVIARQLREAAEKETDPELQKKLWDEYRRYKSGSR